MADNTPRMLTFEAYEELNNELEELSMKATRLFFKRYFKKHDESTEKKSDVDEAEYVQNEVLYQATNDRIEDINQIFLNCTFDNDPRFSQYKIAAGSDFSLVVTDDTGPHIVAGHIYDEEPVFNPNSVENFYLALNQDSVLAQLLIGKQPGDEIKLHQLLKKDVSYRVVIVAKKPK